MTVDDGPQQRFLEVRNFQGEVARFGSSITGLDELGCLM